jgi:dolichol-phosphate mannosyltransferase
MSSTTSNERWLRGVKFYAVGGVGIVVQLIALVVFRSLLHLDYRLAIVLAVEAAVLHNFVWHERFTWADRVSSAGVFGRFVKFNVTNGLLSIVGNVLLMQFLVSGMGINYLVANVVTIAACSVVNFLVSDRFVFQA